MTTTAVIVVMIAQTSFGTLFTVLVGNTTGAAFYVIDNKRESINELCIGKI